MCDQKEKDKYPVFQIKTYDKIEQLGTKEKFWFYSESDKTVRLCKVGRPGTGENWDEKVTGELAKLLTIPCASYDFAVWMDKECVISPSFVPPYYRLIHGNELLSSFVAKDYPKNQKYKVTKYKLSAVEELLVSLNKHKRLMLPIGFTANDSIESAMDIFISYLLFDCFISNPDRHHENWGILLDNKSQKYHLAPTYDHASGLGCRVSDEEREKRLSTKDKRYTIGSFVNRPRTPFYDNGSNRLKIIDAFTSLAKKNKIAANYWLNKLETVPDEAILNIFNKIPDDLISRVAINFAVSILKENKKRLLTTKKN